MASPEQNALLALQLFSQPVEQFNSQNNARTNLMLQVAMKNRDEQLRRDLATQGYDKSIELAGLQADREDKRWKAQDDREGTRMTALQTREDTRANAADLKQLRNSIASTYPKYAAEATRLGEKVRPITSFQESWEGLGDLQAEMARLEQGRVRRDQDAAATAVVGELDDALAVVKDQKKSLEALMKPSPDDEEFARARAVEAVRRSLEMGEVAGAPKAKSKAATSGLAALERGDVAEAKSLLGPNVLSQYDLAYQTSLQATPNFKGRMQQLTIGQQNYQNAQRNLASIQSDLRKAAAGNASLATKLTERRAGLLELMTPEVEAPKKRRTFEEITPTRPGSPAPGAAPGGTTQNASPAGPGIISRGMSALTDIGRSEVNERAPWLAPTVNAFGRAASTLGPPLKRSAAFVGNAAMNPLDTLLAMIEAEAQRRRAAEQPNPEELLISAGPD